MVKRKVYSNVKSAKGAKKPKASKAATKRQHGGPANKVRTARHKKPVAPVLASPVKKSKLTNLLASTRFAKIYVWLAVFLLLASTVFWGILGALVNQSNADQLVDNYLFESTKTFHGALFPDAHTFLIKWPLFIAMKYIGLSAWSFGICTVVLAVATVGAFAFLLYRIERRPLVLGTWYLALASVFLLVPAQPYPGGILPVNMAMITTRNIEYIFYLASLILIVRSRRWLDWRLAAAMVVLAVLAASDNLFIDMSLGGAVLMLVLFTLRWAKWQMALAGRWLLVSLLALASAWGIHALLRWSQVTHISSTVGAGPFGFVHNTHDILLGTVYAGLDLLTNFGANPAAHIAVLRQIPAEAMHGLSNVGAITFITNFGLFIVGLYWLFRFIWQCFKKPGHDPKESMAGSAAGGLSLMLIATTLVGLVMFVASSHYYPVDARYLQITVFTVFVVCVTYLRSRQLRPRVWAILSLLLLVGVGCGALPAWRSYQSENAAMHTVNLRDQQIVHILDGHHVNTLVGDYWRVMPIKLGSNNKVNVQPLSACSQARDVLSSQTWQTDIRNHKFAYLLTLDGATLTGYPKCTLQQIVASYGRPDSSALVAGTLKNPQEMVLFYDRGTDAAKRAAIKMPKTETDTVLPIPIAKLPHVECSSATIMNIVAHQDDDLLFINPSTLHAIQAGDCLRTIYVTAGDAGGNEAYWLGREKGAEAAYSAMLGLTNTSWIQRTVELPSGQYVVVANPRGASKVSLIFMRLPDGNLGGQGFIATHHTSIARLYVGNLKEITSVDGQSRYTATQLVSAMATLMSTYQPSEINTQSSLSIHGIRDHSDHRTVGNLATEAYQEYSAQKEGLSIKYYMGYPTRGQLQNVLGADLVTKQKAFLAYAAYDGGVCHTEEECASPKNNYSAYLRREYEAVH